jgi:hypothetical protein
MTAGTVLSSADRAMVAMRRVMKTTPFRFYTEDTLDFGLDGHPRSSSLQAGSDYGRSHNRLSYQSFAETSERPAAEARDAEKRERRLGVKMGHLVIVRFLPS